MFERPTLPARRRRFLPQKWDSKPPPERESRVRASKTEGVTQRDIQRLPSRRANHRASTYGIHGLNVDRGRNPFLAQGHEAHQCFHCAGRAERMAYAAFRGANRNVLCAASEEAIYCESFCRIVVEGSGAVRINITNLGRIEVGRPARRLHGQEGSCALRMRLREVVRIPG